MRTEIGRAYTYWLKDYMRLDGLVARMTSVPANNVGQDHYEHKNSQGSTHNNGNQHVVLI